MKMKEICSIVFLLLPFYALGQSRRPNRFERVSQRRDHRYSSSENLLCVNGRRAKAPCIPNRSKNPCEKPFDFSHTCQLLQGRTTEYFCCETTDYSNVDEPQKFVSRGSYSEGVCPDGDEPTYTGCEHNSDCLDLQCSLLNGGREHGCCRPLPTTTAVVTTTTTTTPSPTDIQSNRNILNQYMLLNKIANDFNPTGLRKSSSSSTEYMDDYYNEDEDAEQLGSCPGTLDKPAGSCILELGSTLISPCKPLNNHYCVYTSNLATACCPLMVGVPDIGSLFRDSNQRQKKRPASRRRAKNDHYDSYDLEEASEESQQDSLFVYPTPISELSATCPKSGYKPGEICIPDSGYSLYNQFRCKDSETCTFVSLAGYRCCKKKTRRRSNVMAPFAALQILNRELMGGLSTPDDLSPFGAFGNPGGLKGLVGGLGGLGGLGSRAGANPFPLIHPFIYHLLLPLLS